MYVCIDMGVRDQIRLILFTDTEQHEHISKRGNREVLHALEEALREHDRSADDVMGVAVVIGVGGFTGTRLATTVANTFSYIKQVPVIGIEPSEMGDLPALRQRLASTKPGTYISAQYSGEPNIGSPAS